MEEFSKMDERRMHVKSKKGILCFNIGIVHFTNHPLFSKEHQIASELTTSVGLFLERDSLRLFDVLYDKLKVSQRRH